MSWHFSFHAKNKVAADAALADASITGAQFPLLIGTAASNMVDEVSKVLPEGKMLSVMSSGHINSYSASAVIELKIVNGPLG